MKRTLLILLLLLISGCASSQPVPDTQPNVLIICIDALRFDRLTPTLMPTVYALGEQEDAVFYLNAYAPSPWTLPSIASFFTGRIPSESRVLFPGDYMQDEHRTLAEVFRGAGWHTVGISANPTVNVGRGFSQGFDDWIGHRPFPYRDAGRMVDLAMENVPVKKPWFMYLHFMEPHLPYAPPILDDPGIDYEDMVMNGDGSGIELGDSIVTWTDEHTLHWLTYEGPFQLSSGTLSDIREYEVDGLLTEPDVIRLRDLYDAECRYCDAEIWRLFEYLKASGVWDNTTVLVFADHGEELHERGGWGHGGTMYEEQIHVPAVLRDVTGSDLPEPFDLLSTTDLSRYLRSVATGEGVAWPRHVFVEGMIRAELERKVIIDSDMMKIIVPVRTSGVGSGGGSTISEMYDLSADPDEEHNLYAIDQNKFYELLSLMPGGSLGPHHPNRNEIEELRALGYLR